MSDQHGMDRFQLVPIDDETFEQDTGPNGHTSFPRLTRYNSNEELLGEAENSSSPDATQSDSAENQEIMNEEEPEQARTPPSDAPETNDTGSLETGGLDEETVTKLLVRARERTVLLETTIRHLMVIQPLDYVTLERFEGIREGDVPPRPYRELQLRVDHNTFMEDFIEDWRDSLGDEQVDAVMARVRSLQRGDWPDLSYGRVRLPSPLFSLIDMRPTTIEELRALPADFPGRKECIICGDAYSDRDPPVLLHRDISHAIGSRCLRTNIGTVMTTINQGGFNSRRALSCPFCRGSLVTDAMMEVIRFVWMTRVANPNNI